MRFKALVGLSVAAVVVLSAGCSAQTENGEVEGAAGEPLRVGVILPFSGNFALEGEEVKRGYEMALADVENTIAGRPVELILGDGFAPEDVIAEVDRLATRENVDMFIGTYATPASQAGSEAAARYGLAWYETHATTDTLTERGLDNYIRSTARAVDFGRAAAEFAIDAVAPLLDKEDISVFIEHEAGPYGTGVANTQARLLTTAGFTVTQGAHQVTATDMTDSILAAKAANPDIWINTGYVADSTLLLRTAAQLDFKPTAMMLTGAGDSKAVLEAVGIEDLEGVFVTAYTSKLISEEYAPGMAGFLERYEELYGSLPPDSVSMVGYTGMTAAIKLLEQANGSTDTADLRAAADEIDLPFGSLPIGWGLSFNREYQNELIRMAVVQWRKDGTTPAVWPEVAALEGQKIVLN